MKTIFKLTSMLIIQTMLLGNYAWAKEINSSFLTPRLMLLDTNVMAGFRTFGNPDDTKKHIEQNKISSTGPAGQSVSSKRAAKIQTEIKRYRPSLRSWEAIRKEIMRVGKDYFGQGKDAGHFWPKIEKSFQSPRAISLIATAKIRGKERIIGYLTGVPESEDRIYAVGAAVEERYRQNKIASKLFREFVRISREYGFRKLKVHTDEQPIIKAIRSAGCDLSIKLKDSLGPCLFFNIPEEEAEIVGPLVGTSVDIEALIEQAI